MGTNISNVFTNALSYVQNMPKKAKIGANIGVGLLACSSIFGIYKLVKHTIDAQYDVDKYVEEFIRDYIECDSTYQKEGFHHILSLGESERDREENRYMKEQILDVAAKYGTDNDATLGLLQRMDRYIGEEPKSSLGEYYLAGRQNKLEHTIKDTEIDIKYFKYLQDNYYD